MRCLWERVCRVRGWDQCVEQRRDADWQDPDRGRGGEFLFWAEWRDFRVCGAYALEGEAGGSYQGSDFGDLKRRKRKSFEGNGGRRGEERREEMYI